MVLEERVTVRARPARVWELVADPAGMPALSPELHHIEWVGDPTPETGGTFRGYNRVGPVRWRTRNIIEVVAPEREFAWRTMDGPGYGFVTRWTYLMRPEDGACQLTERFETVSLLAAVITRGVLWGRGRMLRHGMRTTLEAIKAAAERDP